MGNRIVFRLSSWHDSIERYEVLKESANQVVVRGLDQFKWTSTLRASALKSRPLFDSWDAARSALVQKVSKRIIRDREELAEDVALLEKIKSMKEPKR